LVAAVVFYLAVSGEGKGPNVTLKEAPQEAASSGGADPGSEEGSSVREVYTRDGPGVVTIDVGSEKEGPRGGSGFVIDENGYIVTNQHVVSGADTVSVRFSSGGRTDAEVVGEDASTDIAVVKADAPEDTLKPLALGDSDSLGVGDPVIAIGNPLNVGISVTTGIVSGLGRPIKAPNRYTIEGAVQTDAAVNPGSSGGPLLDERGTVVGVIEQLASDTGGFQGVGFAVPINTAKGAAEQLIEGGKVEHGYIGVKMFQVGIEELAAYSGRSAEELYEEYGLSERGAIVSEVTEGGPAEEAGIKGGERTEEISGIPVPIGDVITDVEGERVSTPDDVIKVVNSAKPGDTLNLTVVSPGEEAREVAVSLGLRPDDQQQ
jgi:S1-C subfamily serine protease